MDKSVPVKTFSLRVGSDRPTSNRRVTTPSREVHRLVPAQPRICAQPPHVRRPTPCWGSRRRSAGRLAAGSLGRRSSRPPQGADLPSRYPRTGTTGGVSARDQPSTLFHLSDLSKCQARHFLNTPGRRGKTKTKGTLHKGHSHDPLFLQLSAGKEDNKRTDPWPSPLGPEARGV